MPLYNKIIEKELNDEEKELGTADPLNLRGGLQILGEKYQELPEDVRTNVQEAGSRLGTAWEGAKKIDYKGRDPLGYVSDYAAFGVSHGLEKAAAAYNFVIEPVKKELSKITGLDPIYLDTAEVVADFATPLIPLTLKKANNVLDVLNPKIWKRTKGKQFVKLTPEEAYPNWDPELGGYAMYSIDDAPNINLDDIPGPIAGPRKSKEAPPVAWGVDIDKGAIANLPKVVYEMNYGDLQTSLANVSKYKPDLTNWTREVYKPLMDKAALTLGMPKEVFYSKVATQPRFAYIEHLIAKGDNMQWYWEMVGDPNIPWYVKANDISNLRVFLDDRLKPLKDAVEVQIYGGSKGPGGINLNIKDPKQRYIVDFEAPTTGKDFQTLEHISGDIVIRKAGSGETVGKIGAYYDVLYTDSDQLVQALSLGFKGQADPKFPGGYRPDWTGQNVKAKIQEWRKGIINDHLDIIRQKEASLAGLDETQRYQKIQRALNEDMVNFRQQYEEILPFVPEGFFYQLSKDMSDVDIQKIFDAPIEAPNIRIKQREIIKPKPEGFEKWDTKRFLNELFPSDDEITGPFTPVTKRKTITKKTKYLPKE